MKNTVSYALFMLLVTGALMTGCAAEITEEVMEEIREEMNEDDGVSEVRVEIIEDDSTSVEVEVAEPAEEPTVEEAAPVEEPQADANEFANGSYTASASYNTPAGAHNLSVTLNVENDQVVWVQASSDGKHPESQEYTERFLGGLDARVVGVPLADLGRLGAVNGASLTPKGFDAALEQIRSQAEAAAQ